MHTLSRKGPASFALSLLLLTLCIAGCGASKNGSATGASNSDPAAQSVIGNTVVPAPGGAVTGSGEVARVGSHVITRTAFEDRLRLEARTQSPTNPIVPVPPSYSSCIAALEAAAKGLGAGTRPAPAQLKSQCAQTYRKLRTQIMSELIASEWLIVGAEEAGITVSDEEVRRSFTSNWVPSRLRQYLAQTGANVSDLLWSVKVNMLNQRLRQKIAAGTAAVTPALVAKYYSTHKAQFTTPEERDIGIIRARSLKTAHRVKAELEAGTSFPSIAGRLRPQPLYLASKGPGLVDGLKRHILHESALDTAIFTAPLHVISGPVRLNLFPGYHPRFHKNPNDINNIDGYYVFQVRAIRPAHLKPLSQVKAGLEQELPKQMQKEALVAYIKAWRARLRPRTVCQPGFVVRKCAQYKAGKGEQPEDAYTFN